MKNKLKIGIMQGRLSPIYRNKIQTFPFDHWRTEFKISNEIKLNILEWTIDNFKFEKNPIMQADKINEIQFLKKKYNINIPSVTADFFMEDKYFIKKKIKSYCKFFRFIDMCFQNKIKMIVIPLVDNSSIKKNQKYIKQIINDFKSYDKLFKKKKIKIAFETDLPPHDQLRFIKSFRSNTFGINYDIGNSIGNNYDFKEEISCYIKYIFNIHIKNKTNNMTSPLSEKNYKIVKYFLKKNYKVNFIFLSARAKRKHKFIIKNYLRKLNNSL